MPPAPSILAAWPFVASHSYLAGSTPQALAPASLGRSKPNSFLEGTDNDVFIPYQERCRSFSLLFVHVSTVPSCWSWKSLEKMVRAPACLGFARVHTLASQWEMPSLMWPPCFTSPPYAGAGEHINEILCSQILRSMSSRLRWPMTLSLIMDEMLL